MNQAFYFLAELYPWWGVPLAFIMLELGNYFRRQNRKKQAYICIVLSFVFLALTAAYFFGNGFKTIRPGLYEVEKQYMNK